MVFSYIMVTDDWNEDFIKNILDIIDSDLVDPYTINMIVSAVFIVMLCIHGSPRLGVLMRLIKSAGSTCVFVNAPLWVSFSP